MKKKTNPATGITDAALRSQCRSALRKTWRATSRKKFLEGARVPHEGAGRGKYDVICEQCGKRMGFSEKKLLNKVDGTPRKSKTLVYNVDHIDGCHELLDIKRDLGEYAHSLIFGKMRILCMECHTQHTKNQRKK